MTDYSWIGGDDNWTNAADWSPSGGPPTSADTATLDGTTTYTVTVDSADAASALTISDDSATLNVDGSSASLTIGGTFSMSAGTVNIGGATPSGDLVVNGALDLSGGALTVYSGGSLDLGGTLSQTGGTLTLDGGTIPTGGVVQLSGGTLDVTANSTIGSSFTQSGGAASTVSISTGDTLTISGAATFVNCLVNGPGTLKVTGAATLTNVLAGSPVTLEDANSVTIELSVDLFGGALQIDGGATATINGVLDADTAINFNGANATLNLFAPQDYANTIGGVGFDDTIFLNGIHATSATYGSGFLTTFNGGAVPYRLKMTGDNSGLAFVTQAAVGGTNVVALPKIATVAQYLAVPTLFDSISGGFAISDTAADISAALDSLNGGNITSITISDNAPIAVTAAQMSSDATAIGKLANANPTAVAFAIVDTAADITAALNSLNGSNIVSITISDDLAVGVNVAQLTSDATAIGKLANASPYQLAVTDTAADISAALDSLNGSPIASITVSDNAPLGVTVAQLTSDATAISKLANANATAYQLAVTDSLSAIIGDLGGLNGDSHVASLTGTSGGAKLSSGTIAAPAFALSGSSATVLTLAEILTYSGSFSEGAASTVSISTGDTLTLNGTTSLGGRTIGKGAFALAGGATTIAFGASISTSTWSVSGNGTSVTLGESLGYAGSFSAGAGTTLNLTGGNLTLWGADSFAGATTSGSKILSAKGTTTLSGLTIGGTTTFSDGGALSESGGSATVGDAAGRVAKLTITATGTWDITDDSGIGRGSSTSSAITNSGLLEKTGAGPSVITPKVTNNGVNTGGAAVNGGIYVSSGTLDFKGAVTGGTVATPGTDTISGASSVLEFDSAVGSSNTVGSQDVLFNGGTLDLRGPKTFWGEISGFAPGDAIDLLGKWTFSGISDASGVTTLTLLNGTAAHAFTFVGDYPQNDFNIGSGKTTVITHT